MGDKRQRKASQTLCCKTELELLKEAKHSSLFSLSQSSPLTFIHNQIPLMLSGQRWHYVIFIASETVIWPTKEPFPGPRHLLLWLGTLIFTFLASTATRGAHKTQFWLALLPFPSSSPEHRKPGPALCILQSWKKKAWKWKASLLGTMKQGIT